MVERTDGTRIKVTMKTIANHKSQIANFRAFTLVELLVVISIMAVLAGFTIPVLKTVKAAQQKKVARAELEHLQTALENYKAKYGFYPPSNLNTNAAFFQLLPQLYYELSGMEAATVGGAPGFQTLDGSASIKTIDVLSAYGVSGFINCSKGNGDDDIKAKNFLTGIRQKQVYNLVTNNGVATTVLVTSVGGPDDSYTPLITSGLNPIRYRYPGIKNPGSYDLWVQLSVNGKNHLICNWTRQVPINDTSVP